MNPGSTLTPVPPPDPPSDLTPGALAIPLSDVGTGHVGRKLRLVVQVLDVSSPRANHFVATGNGAPRPTLLVDVGGVLLAHTGPTAVLTGTSASADRPHVESPSPSLPRLPDGARVARMPLTLRPGEWVTIVGWIESSPLPANLGPPPAGFAPLPPLVLSCIHVSPAREPPADAVYRGQLD